MFAEIEKMKSQASNVTLDVYAKVKYCYNQF